MWGGPAACCVTTYILLLPNRAPFHQPTVSEQLKREAPHIAGGSGTQRTNATLHMPRMRPSP